MTPEEVALLSELTIIIPTYNRPLELERAIEYWRDTPITVHILDGSEKPWFPVGPLPRALNTTYHHFPIREEEGQKENYLYRIKTGVALSNTKYSALCADDDIFLLEGVAKAIKLIKSNKNIDSVTGQNCWYLNTNTDVLWIKEGSQNCEIERFHPEISRRIFSKVLIPNYYGIFKTEIWKQIHEVQTSYCFKNLVCNEFLTHFLILILSRNFVINSHLWVRNHNHPNPSGISDNQVKFGDWINHKKNREEVEIFIKTLSNSILTIDPSISRNTAENLVRLMLSRVPRNRPTYKQMFERKVKSRLLFSLSYLPKIVRHELFIRLPYQLQERIGNDDFKINFKPTHFVEEEISRSFEFKNWKNILLMPREELRLRANI